MSKFKVSFVASISILLLTSAFNVSAGTINISLSPSDWSLQHSEIDTPVLTTVSGNLQATPDYYRGRVNRKTNDTYNFQNATLEYKWKVNSIGGVYSAVTTGIGQAYVFDPNGTSQYFYSTHNSWVGSEVISNNTWIYSQIKFTEASINYSVSYNGYGGTDFLNGSYATGAARWENIVNDYFWFRYEDNYNSTSYFELAEASITTQNSQGSNAVPEPTTMLLFGTGIAGLAAVGRRKRQ